MNKELEKIGEIVHYFGDIKVAVVKATEDKISVGDQIKINGATTDFEQKIESLQVDKEDVEEIEKGEEAGMKVESRVREGDQIYRLE
jgi:U32 family peptidase